MEIPGFDIRFSEIDDAAYLCSWLSRAGECDGFPFNEEEKDDAAKNWVGFSKYKASLTGVLGDQVVAVGTLFLMPYRKVAHNCSFYLIVDPDHRRKGIGTSMVRNLLHLAKNKFKLESVHAEIFPPSPIESILLRLDFLPFALQDDFVKIDETHFRPRLLLEHFFV